MPNVVTWLWKSDKDYHAQYTPEHVNTLRRMVARHYRKGHKFFCVTDCIPKGLTSPFDPSVILVPLWNEHAELKNPYGPGTPSCYRRLKAFAPEMAGVFGNRFVSMDLDCVVMGDLEPVFERPEDFIIWRSFARQTQYNGSMWMMNAGAREKVWTKFAENPERAITRARGAGFFGSDQAWMNYILGPKERYWGDHDGVYSYRRHMKNTVIPPNDARIIFFEGRYSPWDKELQAKQSWISDNYR